MNNGKVTDDQEAAVVIEDVLDDRQDRLNVIIHDDADGRLADAEGNRAAVLAAAVAAPAGRRVITRAELGQGVGTGGEVASLLALPAPEIGVGPCGAQGPFTGLCGAAIVVSDLLDQRQAGRLVVVRDGTAAATGANRDFIAVPANIAGT